MLLVQRKSDRAIFADFQSNAAPGTLIANAVRAGFASADDLEEIEATPAQFDAAVEAAYGNQRRAEATARQAVRNRVVAIVSGTVGVRFEDLTPAQRNALLAATLFSQGVLDNQGKVAALNQWLTD